jgi:hypothetical protein
MLRMTESRSMLSMFDIVGYINENKFVCLLCVDEKNIPKNFPITSDIQFDDYEHCSICDVELAFKIKDWECVSCGTNNQHWKNKCDGCDFGKREKYRY